MRATGRAGLAPRGRRRLGPWTHAGWNRHCTAPSTGSGNFKPRPGRPLHVHAAEIGVDTVHVALECQSARGATRRAVPQTCRAASWLLTVRHIANYRRVKVHSSSIFRISLGLGEVRSAHEVRQVQDAHVKDIDSEASAPLEKIGETVGRLCRHDENTFRRPRGRRGECVRSLRRGQRLRGDITSCCCAPTPRPRRRCVYLRNEQHPGACRCQ